MASENNEEDSSMMYFQSENTFMESQDPNNLCLFCENGIKENQMGSKVQKALYQKYCNNLNTFFYLKDIRGILEGKRSNAVITLQEWLITDFSNEMLKREYKANEFKDKINQLWRHYGETVLIPKVVIKNVMKPLNRYYRFKQYAIKGEISQYLRDEDSSFSSSCSSRSKKAPRIAFKGDILSSIRTKMNPQKFDFSQKNLDLEISEIESNSLIPLKDYERSKQEYSNTFSTNTKKIDLRYSKNSQKLKKLTQIQKQKSKLNFDESYIELNSILNTIDGSRPSLSNISYISGRPSIVKIFTNENMGNNFENSLFSNSIQGLEDENENVEQIIEFNSTSKSAIYNTPFVNMVKKGNDNNYKTHNFKKKVDGKNGIRNTKETLEFKSNQKKPNIEINSNKENSDITKNIKGKSPLKINEESNLTSQIGLSSQRSTKIKVGELFTKNDNDKYMKTNVSKKIVNLQSTGPTSRKLFVKKGLLIKKSTLKITKRSISKSKNLDKNEFSLSTNRLKNTRFKRVNDTRSIKDLKKFRKTRIRESKDTKNLPLQKQNNSKKSIDRKMKNINSTASLKKDKMEVRHQSSVNSIVPLKSKKVLRRNQSTHLKNKNGPAANTYHLSQRADKRMIRHKNTRLRASEFDSRGSQIFNQGMSMAVQSERNKIQNRFLSNIQTGNQRDFMNETRQNSVEFLDGFSTRKQGVSIQQLLKSKNLGHQINLSSKIVPKIVQNAIKNKLKKKSFKDLSYKQNAEDFRRRGMQTGSSYIGVNRRSESVNIRIETVKKSFKKPTTIQVVQEVPKKIFRRNLRGSSTVRLRDKPSPFQTIRQRGGSTNRLMKEAKLSVRNGRSVREGIRGSISVRGRTII